MQMPILKPDLWDLLKFLQAVSALKVREKFVKFFQFR